MQEAYILFVILGITLGLFVWGRLRYDIVALITLVSLTVLGIIPSGKTFIGFSNPAVITVACVMMITAAIMDSGLIERLVNQLTPLTSNVYLHLASLLIITAVLSAFMNNVGALALMMPIAIHTASTNKRSPSLVLMPLAFGSVLGGMTTAIGTPPNLLISAYRQQITGHPFALFDFSPVGLWVALTALIFIIFLGWHLIPLRLKPQKQSEDMYHIQDYISEIRVPEESPYVGEKLLDLESAVEGDFTIIGMIRGRQKKLAISPDEALEVNDILIIEAAHEELEQLISAGKLDVGGDDNFSQEFLRSKDIMVTEAVVPPGSRVEGRSWKNMRIRSRLRINLLAISRSSSNLRQRLNQVNLRGGDVVLLQGYAETLHESIVNLGLVPLVERSIKIGTQRRAFLPTLIFLSAILLSAFGLAQIQIALSLAVILLVLTNSLPVRRLYSSIDWSIIVLLGAMIPIGNAMQTTHATQLIANFITHLGSAAPDFVLIGLILVITMTLSDIMNNAATAIVMAPIAVSIANTLGVSIDPFLMAVAIGASCSFLTPISHQNNTIVMGPGGYKFFDYTRLGLPVELIVLIIGIPMILYFWPL